MAGGPSVRHDHASGGASSSGGSASGGLSVPSLRGPGKRNLVYLRRAEDDAWALCANGVRDADESSDEYVNLFGPAAGVDGC